MCSLETLLVWSLIQTYSYWVASLFTKSFRTGSRGDPAFIQRIPVFFFLEVKRPGRDVDYWPHPLSNAEAKSRWSYTTAPSVCFHGVDRVCFVVSVKRNTLIPKLRETCYRLNCLSDLPVAETVTKILGDDIVIVLEFMDITNWGPDGVGVAGCV